MEPPELVVLVGAFRHHDPAGAAAGGDVLPGQVVEQDGFGFAVEPDEDLRAHDPPPGLMPSARASSASAAWAARYSQASRAVFQCRMNSAASSRSSPSSEHSWTRYAASSRS